MVELVSKVLLAIKENKGIRLKASKAILVKLVSMVKMEMMAFRGAKGIREEMEL
jgi:hypothetical protein